MTVVLKVGNRTITSEEIVPLLASYQLLPRLLFELIIDEAIAPFTYTFEEEESAYQKFCQRNHLNSNTELQTWLKRNGMTTQQLQTYVRRSLKIEKFKQATWGNQLESHFRSRKSEFDQVLFSLIQTNDLAAQELYFRILEKEADFAELARKYSQDANASNGGLIGPVSLSNCHQTLAKMLSVSQPGQLWPPTRLGESMAIVRMEKLIPAQLDDLMRQRLLSELFAAWLQEQFNQVGEIGLLPQDFC
ncbi:MAG: peptidylprolyl isomerase [Nostoc sp. C3-bin3]|nr:peptidylprolyl isomerase [Nostoc sp. C3-bin3]